MIKSFDIDTNFYSQSPEFKILFKEEIKLKIPSEIMWALVLFIHPSSKFATLDHKSRLSIIEQDYLGYKLELDKYELILDKIKKYIMTPAQRVLSSWNNKLFQREEFIDSVSYSADTYEMLDKMLKDTHAMMKQYKVILEEFSMEQATSTHGDVEESLLEKGLI